MIENLDIAGQSKGEDDASSEDLDVKDEHGRHVKLGVATQIDGSDQIRPDVCLHPLWQLP